MIKYFLLFVLVFQFVAGVSQVTAVKDEPFSQEYHEAYPFEGAIRKILADRDQNIWIATATGVWKKDRDKKVWTQQYREPSFALASDDKGNIWMGTWNAVWLADGQSLKKINGTDGPISILCHSPSGMYAIGPKGMWLFNGTAFVKQKAVIPRSVRDAVADENGGLWLASDVGLYHVVKDSSIHFRDTSVLISAAQKGLAFSKDGTLWSAGLGGINILKNEFEN